MTKAGSFSVNKPTKLDWARLAAFIDGEGSITIDTKRDTKRRIRTALRVGVANTNPLLMKWLTGNFGGSVGHTGPGENREKQWAICYRWSVTSLHAVWVIKECRPYFVIKGDQADIAIAHQKLCTRVGFAGHDKSVYEERMRLRDELSLLKNAGHRRKDLRSGPSTSIQ